MVDVAIIFLNLLHKRKSRPVLLYVFIIIIYYIFIYIFVYIFHILFSK